MCVFYYNLQRKYFLKEPFFVFRWTNPTEKMFVTTREAGCPSKKLVVKTFWLHHVFDVRFTIRDNTCLSLLLHHFRKLVDQKVRKNFYEDHPFISIIWFERYNHVHMPQGFLSVCLLKKLLLSQHDHFNNHVHFVLFRLEIL